MKLASKKDVEAPIATVWAALVDFETWERAAMRRGVEVARTDQLRAPGVGMSWHARFSYRGKQRKVIWGAQHYLMSLPSLPPCRFDVVAIDGGSLQWLKAAFDAG
mgnify:CR=1 FL=1